MYIKGLNGLRALSIIMVIVSHTGVYDSFFFNNPSSNRILALFSGNAGVNIFFSLSGFLITWLLLTEKKTKGKICYSRFYIRRFFRLSPPLVLFFLTLLVLGFLHLIHVSKFSILLSALYLYNYAPNSIYDVKLGSTWSLALEEQYYLIWPFIIGHLSKYRQLIIAAFVIVVLCIAANIFLYDAAFTIGSHHILLGRDFKVNRFFFPAVGPVIIGAIFSIITFHNASLLIMKRLGNSILLVCTLFYCFPLYAAQSMMLFSDLVQAIGIGLLLLYLFVHNAEKHFIGKVLEVYPLAYIGKISYGVYVYQSFFLTTAGNGELWVQQFPQNLVFTLVVSILSYHFWEMPAMQYRDVLLKKLNLSR